MSPVSGLKTQNCTRKSAVTCAHTHTHTHKLCYRFPGKGNYDLPTTRPTPQYKPSVRQSVPIHVFRERFCHKFSSSLFSEAESGLFTPPPSLTMSVSSYSLVFWEYAERFPKGYRKPLFHVVQPS